jgi:glycosyltransferase involved in cell wall biosynthesis
MISFIVPAYNEEFELARTLEAIHAAAENQDHEIVVVDDASTDGTAGIAKRFGAVVMPINRRQIAAARNAGARISKGEVLFFVDADTRVDRTHIDQALASLDSGYAGGSARIAADEPVPRWGHLMLRLLSTMYFAMNLGAGAFLFTTRKNYEAVGGFDENYFAGEEVWFSMALKKLGRFKVLDEPVRSSGRKLRMHSPWSLCWQAIRVVLGGPAGCRSRKPLDLWYDGKREGAGISKEN